MTFVESIDRQIIVWCNRCRCLVERLLVDHTIDLNVTLRASCHGETVKITLSRHLLATILPVRGPHLTPLYSVPPFFICVRSLDINDARVASLLGMTDGQRFEIRSSGGSLRAILDMPSVRNHLHVHEPRREPAQSQTVPTGVPSKPTCFDCNKRNLTEYMTAKEGGYTICLPCFEYRQAMGRAKEAKGETI